MHTVEVLNHVVRNNQLFAYVLIFLLTIVEGEVVGISSGILVLLGALNIWVALIALFLGGMAKTCLGYSIGVVLRRNFENSRFLAYIEKKIVSIMPRFKEKPFWSIFISKFILGLNHLVIVFSGYRKIRFKTFLRAEILSTLLWAPEMIALGYFFSYTAIRVSKHLSDFLLVVVLLIVGFFILDKLISLLYNVFENLYNNNV